VDGDALSIGDNVMISHSASVLSGSHYYDEKIPMRDLVKDTPIVIGNNVWIGAGARIVGGNTIGDDVIIGANAVVTKSIPSNSVAVGVPAKVIKKVTDTIK
jgi:maltose O-acetyltransferase